MYSAGPSAMTYVDTIAANNICHNCGWTGVYVACGQGVNSGGTISIVGNIVEYCGGSSPLPPPPTNPGLNGGILVGNNGPPVLVAHNYIRKSGYDKDGNARPVISSGIYIPDNFGEMTVEGNIIEASSGAGLLIIDYLSSVSIKNNTFLDNGNNTATDDSNAHIVIDSVSPGTSAVFIEIVGNKFQFVNQNAHGIYLDILPTSTTSAVIRGNSLMGKKIADSPIPPAGTGPNRGIFVHASHPKFPCVIQGNLINGWDEGMNLGAESPNLLPVKLFLANNVISNNGTGIVHALSGAGNYGMIFGNLFDGNTTDIDPHSTDPAIDKTYGIKQAMGMSPAAGGVGNRLMFFNSGQPSALASGSWNVGTIAFDTNPAAGGKIGWVYTSSNAWRQFGAIDS